MELESIIKSYTDLHKEVSDKYTRDYNDLSIYDQSVNDILHYIELGKYNAVEGWKLLSELKEILSKRRQTKNEIELLQIIKECKRGNVYKEINKYESQKKKYRMRTDVVKSILGSKYKDVNTYE